MFVHGTVWIVNRDCAMWSGKKPERLFRVPAYPASNSEILIVRKVDAYYCDNEIGRWTWTYKGQIKSAYDYPTVIQIDQLINDLIDNPSLQGGKCACLP